MVPEAPRPPNGFRPSLGELHDSLTDSQWMTVESSQRQIRSPFKPVESQSLLAETR